MSLWIFGGVSQAAGESNLVQAEQQTGRISLSTQAVWITNRYRNNGDGTVYDKQYNLTWQRCAVGQVGTQCEQGEAKPMDWQEAMDYAHAQAGWHLPTREELRNLVCCNQYYHYQRPMINQQAFPNIPFDCFWSSSVYDDGDYGSVWKVNFYNGYGGTGNKDDYNLVRLVRSGE